MSIEIRKAESPEIRKHIRVVQKMTSGMGFDEKMGNVNWRAVRLISGLGCRLMPKEKGVRFKRLRADGLSFEIAIPDKILSKNIIVYIHGGGFVSGSAVSSRGYSSMLCAYSGCRVIAVDYSLAPEKPFPYGFNDCCLIVERIAEKLPKAKIALVGESAGGNLCVGLGLKYANKISSVTVHSPFMDFTGKLDRTEHKIRDFTVKIGCLKPLNEIYVVKNSADDPYISPVFGDFAGFPPTFITCDANETLFADSIWLYRKLKGLGIAVKMIEMRGAFHAFSTIGTGSPETKLILKENIEFIRSAFKK
ncbi:MAG: alpha/beta hydrolase [Ruminococcus sp.]|nr:alpha/beta hydrolase [Ruminococcus sp.]